MYVVGTADTVLIREMSFIERFHCMQPTCMYRATVHSCRTCKHIEGVDCMYALPMFFAL